MRVLVAGAIAALLPAVAGAQSANISFNVQNCAPVDIAVAPLVPSDPRYLGSSTVARGETRSVWCPVATGCWIQISYRTSPTFQLGTYQHAYTSDRCTRGTEDVAVGDLPAIGNCGC